MRLAGCIATPRRRSGGGKLARFAAPACMLVMLASTASAMSIRELRGLEQSDKDNGGAFVQYYLVGAMEGALESQAHAVRAGAKPLFVAELQRNADLCEADMPVQLVFVNALTTAYTC